MYLKVLLLLFCLTCVGQHQEILKTIPWNETLSLKWSDFEGRPFEHSNAAAQTASGITFGFSIDKENSRVVGFTTTVKCLFYPEKSWVKPKLANDYILRHEQLHFDITELHARIFRKKLKQLKTSQNIRNQLNALYKTINKASTKMQKRYDHETNHSINKEKQTQWEEFIVSQLKRLDDFKSQ